ncbi:M4 family metallopeptidase [Hydrogenophaga sp. SL48]|uniref:M4 family metallopeptidase n=1 Tax=Hydrogenophaga sp. SL48 TaxID=2806347 RepID=UPI001F463980|nr:M4 family metallopeptidase [Hydrogenophaga sp. SL48]UJW81184.1 M4 family metallopeptidase [Hydrogenophaga sp. SL48]
MLPASLLLRLAALDHIPEHCRRALEASTRLPARLVQDRTIRASGRVAIFNCDSGEVLPGREVMYPALSKESSELRAWAFTSRFRVFLDEVASRDSIDGKGLRIDSSVTYSRAYSNAFWDGAQCVFGSGDGLMFTDFTSAADFVAHEVLHGFTQFTSEFEYEGEAGALNESISDVLGVSFRQWMNAEFENPDWGLAGPLLGPLALARGWRYLRNLENPQSPLSMTIQPKHYSDYSVGGEPHINSGIPNYAFFLSCVALGQLPSWLGAARVWINAMTSACSIPKASFSDFARLTIIAAGKVLPELSNAPDAIGGAWATVGVKV